MDDLFSLINTKNPEKSLDLGQSCNVFVNAKEALLD
jgi:hypothetical protein